MCAPGREARACALVDDLGERMRMDVMSSRELPEGQSRIARQGSRDSREEPVVIVHSGAG
jgi:hypothetical protein